MFSYKYHRIVNRILRQSVRRLNIPAYSENITVLGIETSCDDTGCAVVNGAGKILGESLFNQNLLHLRYGGVNPIIAHELHRDNIEAVATEALNKASLSMKDVDAIAVTTRPGLLISLQVGVKYSRYISRTYHKPLLPVHHMEAHALVARMFYNLPYPFLVLLISGGHCLLAVVKNTNDFLLLGQSLDNAPGEVMDKAARRMKLRNMPEYSKISGGRAIELAAMKSKKPEMFEFTIPLIRNRDCNFSFSGLKDALVRIVRKKEEKHGIIGSGIIPEVYDLCAAFQRTIAEHIFHRTERAVLFCEKSNLLSSQCKNIVVSGGVACNDFIFNAISLLGDKLGYEVYRPPPKVCTDNGIMIAWNGIEKLRRQEHIITSVQLQDIEPTAPLGVNIIDKVAAASLPMKVTRLLKFHDSNK